MSALSAVRAPASTNLGAAPSAMDLFSGCGGLTEGLKLAGFRVIGAVENEPLAARVYRLNHPEVTLFEDDIQKFEPAKFAEAAGIAAGELTLLAGCPPCQGFSALRTLNGHRDIADDRNDLVFEFVRFAKELRPLQVMLENVPGLLGDTRLELLQKFLRGEGYTVRAKVDQTSQTQIRKFLRVLGLSTAQEEVRPLADALVRAYEFRQFHDVLKDIEAAAEEDPDHLREVLSKLSEWKVLESRAILEIVNGRLSIIDRFQAMLVNDAPETAHRRGDDNIHDLLGRFPWLLNPEWQVLAEEKRITTQLREWAATEISEDTLERFDFLGLAGSGRLVVLEIKRSGYAVEIEDLTRAQTYADRLSRGRGEEITTVVICGGNLNVSEQVKANWDRDPLLEIRPWRELFDRSRLQYERYRALLEGDVQHRDFSEAAVEVASTRQVLDADSSYRRPAERRAGLGRQDSAGPTPPPAVGDEDTR